MRGYSLSHLSDSRLDHELEAAARSESGATAWLLAHLAEADSRRRHVPAGYPSMFEFCVRHLRFSEDAAYKRIRVARAARQFPGIFPMIADGRLHLTAVLVLAPHLTTGNAQGLCLAATHRTKAEVEQLVARRFPRPDVPEWITPIAPPTVEAVHTELAPERVGMTTAGQGFESAEPPVKAAAPAALAELAPERVASPPDRARVAPLSAERFALQCTVGRGTYEKLCRAKALLRHRLPGGELDQVLDRALDALIEQLEKRKFAATEQPQRPRRREAHANPRHIPAEVKRAVWKRDHGQCTFRSSNGRRCEARDRLEFDHEIPVARGGWASAGNLRPRCRAHNQYEAEQTYGTEFMKHKREAARETPTTRAADAAEGSILHDVSRHRIRGLYCAAVSCRACT